MQVPEPKLYRASLLNGECLAINVDGSENEEQAAQATTLKITTLDGDGHVHTTQFWGYSLRDCIESAQAAHQFGYVSLQEPWGEVIHKPVAAAGKGSICAPPRRRSR